MRLYLVSSSRTPAVGTCSVVKMEDAVSDDTNFDLSLVIY